MATTIVYPSIDVSGTASVSTLISTAGTFAGSLTASSLTITGTATFSGTAVFAGTAQFLATVTFSATIVFANATVTTLGVSGTASFSAGMTMNGNAMGSVLLGSLSLLANASIRFSGSWSDYSLFELHIVCKSSGASNTGSIALYTDGGTTAIVSLTTGTVSTAAYNYLEATIINGGGTKSIKSENLSVATQTHNLTATANTGVLNCVQFAAGTSATLSSGHALFYGRRR